MKRVRYHFRRFGIRRDSHWDIRRFERNDNVVKIQLLQYSDVEQGAFHHSLWRRIAVFFKQMILQGTCIHSDPDRNPFLLASLHDSLYLLPATNVARINPHFIDPVLDRKQSQLIIKMNIGHQRYVNLFLDFLDRRSSFLIVHRHADQLTAGFFQSKNFRYRSGNVSCFGGAHALNDYFVTAADR
ncbi:hypothetical protein D3C77_539780 [compost metagenome]